ncbi:MAG: LysR family transcriptional regulator [Pseudomonadota bacterium]
MNKHSVPHIPLLELDLLKTLVAIADTGNFSQAAEAVLRTPSAVSMQVKKMEEMLGRPIFVRDSRRVSLTPDGAALVEHGRRLLALNREMVSRFVEPEVVGEVHLGAPDDVAERFLPPVLRRFDETHCGVALNVVVESTNRMVDMVRDGALDLAIATRNAGFKGTDETEVLLKEPLVWAGLKGGVAAERDPLPVSVWEEGCAWRDAGLKGLQEAGRDYRIRFQSAHISGQRAAILADLVVAPVPRSCLGGDVVEARPSCGLPTLPEYTLGLAVRKDPACAVEAAADHLRASFAVRS